MNAVNLATIIIDKSVPNMTPEQAAEVLLRNGLKPSVVAEHFEAAFAHAQEFFKMYVDTKFNAV